MSTYNIINTTAGACEGGSKSISVEFNAANNGTESLDFIANSLLKAQKSYDLFLYPDPLTQQVAEIYCFN